MRYCISIEENAYNRSWMLELATKPTAILLCHTQVENLVAKQHPRTVYAINFLAN